LTKIFLVKALSFVRFSDSFCPISYYWEKDFRVRRDLSFFCQSEFALFWAQCFGFGFFSGAHVTLNTPEISPKI